jgi:hypothetical protein
VDGGEDQVSRDAAWVDDGDSQVSDARMDREFTDCSTAGCAFAPVCGQPCSSVCGCCNCTAGSQISVDGTTLECKGSCYGPAEEQSACPASAPADGEGCTGTGSCSYMDCSGAGVVTAVCSAEHWTVTATPCLSRSCGFGGVQCDPGELCV